MPKTQISVEDYDANKKAEERELSNFPELNIQSAATHADTGELSSVSAVLQKIWQESLRVSHIDPSDDFFDLGGDSLTAIRMLIRVGSEYGEELLEPDVIYKASRFDDFTKAVMHALAQRTPS